MRKNDTSSFSDAFNRFLKTENLDRAFQEKRLIHSWEKLMGQMIASRTSNLYVRNKVLFVQLLSAPLKQEMLNSRDKVLEIIHKEFGEGLIEDVRVI